MHLLVCHLNKLQNAQCNDKDMIIDFILFIPRIIDKIFTTLTNKMHKNVPEIFILQYYTEQNEIRTLLSTADVVQHSQIFKI